MTDYEQRMTALQERIVIELRGIRESQRVGTFPTFDGTHLGTSDTNRLTVGEDSFLELEGTATVWDDMLVPVLSTKLGGTADPGFAVWKTDGGAPASQGVFLYWFDQTTEEELYFCAQLPHNWKQGSNIHAHVHWVPSSNGTSGHVCSWGLEYLWLNMGSIGALTTIIRGNVHEPADAVLTADKHYYTEIGEITGTGYTMSSMLACRIFRNATGAGGSTDSYTHDAGLLAIDFHYEIDSLGSRTEDAK